MTVAAGSTIAGGGLRRPLHVAIAAAAPILLLGCSVEATPTERYACVVETFLTTAEDPEFAAGNRRKTFDIVVVEGAREIAVSVQSDAFADSEKLYRIERDVIGDRIAIAESSVTFDTMMLGPPPRGDRMTVSATVSVQASHFANVWVLDCTPQTP